MIQSASETRRVVSKYIGRIIVDAALLDDKLIITFEGESKIVVWDDGQCCCEHRYMRTDDDVRSLVGRVLVCIELKDDCAPVCLADDVGDTHEVAFVEVGTNAGFVTLETHNLHNGWYAGFDLCVSEICRKKG